MPEPTMPSTFAGQEYLRVGSGYGAPLAGVSLAGGLDVDNTGNLATDGSMTLDGDLNVKSGSIMCSEGDINFDAYSASGPTTVHVRNTAAGHVANLEAEGALTVQGPSTLGGDVTINHANNPAVKLMEETGKYLLLQDRGGGLSRIVQVNNSGAAVLNFDPKPEDGVSDAKIRMFREQTVTTGAKEFEIYKGSTVGDLTYKVTASTGNVFSKGDMEAQGGDVIAGVDTTTRGLLTLWDGSGGNAPGCIKIASSNGTLWYLFVEDGGTLKVHSALPTANTDGAVVGSQT